MPVDDGGIGRSLAAKGLSEADILCTEYAMIVLVSILILSRLTLQAARRKKLEPQDFFIYFAYACFLGACALYIRVVPILFEIRDVTNGVRAMPADFVQTAGLTARLIWAAQICFYACLWSVKFSLLCLYRKLLSGLPLVYIRIWWSLVLLCFLVGVLSAIKTFAY